MSVGKRRSEGQTVCSGKCRAARWRRQQKTTREAHDREIRELLKAASPKALLRSSPLGTPDLAGLLAWNRTRRRWHRPPGLRSPAHALRRARLARDVLHDGDGALGDERDRLGVGADTVARSGRAPNPNIELPPSKDEEKRAAGCGLFRQEMSKRLDQTSDGKQSQTEDEQLKPCRHFHGVAREVDSHLGSDGRRHREDDKIWKDGADNACHVDTSIPESPVLIPRPEGQSTQPVKRRSASQTSPNTNLGRLRARHRAASMTTADTRHALCHPSLGFLSAVCCLKSARPSLERIPTTPKVIAILLPRRGAFPGFCGVFVVHARDEKAPRIGAFHWIH
jgi:hypothetical protein